MKNYSSNKQQHSKTIKNRCKYGPDCRELKEDKCVFYHPDMDYFSARLKPKPKKCL